jgi:hypothetical protein
VARVGGGGGWGVTSPTWTPHRAHANLLAKDATAAAADEAPAAGLLGAAARVTEALGGEVEVAAAPLPPLRAPLRAPAGALLAALNGSRLGSALLAPTLPVSPLAPTLTPAPAPAPALPAPALPAPAPATVLGPELEDKAAASSGGGVSPPSALPTSSTRADGITSPTMRVPRTGTGNASQLLAANHEAPTPRHSYAPPHSPRHPTPRAS